MSLLRRLGGGLGAVAVVTLAPVPALAHEALGTDGGFVAGFAHPFGGPDHMLAMVAVGLWGAFLGRPLVALLPVVFPGMMALGALAGMVDAPMPPVELGIAASVLALGVAVGAGLRAPVWAACLVVGLFGLFHGYAHGVELPNLVDPSAYCAGFVLATGFLHAVGISLGTLKDARTWGAALLRTGGGAIAAAGLFFLHTALTG